MDRIDPQGGFFQLDAAPRVEQAPGVESAQMQPRTAQKRFRRFLSFAALRPLLYTQPYQGAAGPTINYQDIEIVGAFNNNHFVANLWLHDLPLNTQIVEIGLTTQQKTNGICAEGATVARTGIALYVFNSAGGIVANTARKNSTSNGTVITDTFDITSTQAYVADDQYYELWAWQDLCGGDGVGDPNRIFNVFVTLQLPG